MKEIILSNVSQADDHSYLLYMTYGEFMNLIDKEFIKINIDGMNEFSISNFEAMACSYNNKKDTDKVQEFIQISSYVNNKIGDISLNDKNELTINTDNIEIIDGYFNALFIRGLDKRFMDNKLMFKVYYCTEQEGKSMLFSTLVRNKGDKHVEF